MDRAAYWAARYRRQYRDTRPTGCRGCGSALAQPKRGRRLYCTDACKLRTWHGEHPAAHVPVVHEPMPMAYTGDPVFERARQAAHLTQHTAYSVDWGQNDILGEATLAILEGRDPEEAVRAHRAHEKAEDRRRAYGVLDISEYGWAVRRGASDDD